MSSEVSDEQRQDIWPAMNAAYDAAVIANPHLMECGLSNDELREAFVVGLVAAAPLMREIAPPADAAMVDVEALQGALTEMIDLANGYGEYIATVSASELERHPYLPGVEQAIENARAALAQSGRK